MSRVSRKTDRRHALCLVFALEFHRGEPFCVQEEMEYYCEYYAEDEEGVGNKVGEADYVLRVFSGVLENIEKIDELISNAADSWEIERFAKVDLAIARLAIFEMLYEENIDNSISVNEAVDIAKEFSSEESGKFVNGVLAKIMRGLEGAESGDSGV